MDLFQGEGAALLIQALLSLRDEAECRAFLEDLMTSREIQDCGQRLLVARALAARPEILVLDDSSSALDYRTDAAMRRAIQEHYGDSTLILIAQRVSSIMGMTHILVMDNGACIGYGTHEELLKTCPAYRETYQVQMGEME